MSPFRNSAATDAARLLQLCQQWTAHQKAPAAPHPTTGPRQPPAQSQAKAATLQPSQRRPNGPTEQQATAPCTNARREAVAPNIVLATLMLTPGPCRPQLLGATQSPAAPAPRVALCRDVPERRVAPSVAIQGPSPVDALAAPHFDLLYSSFMVAPSPFFNGETP
eukprot:EG_transcript_13659